MKMSDLSSYQHFVRISGKISRDDITLENMGNMRRLYAVVWRSLCGCLEFLLDLNAGMYANGCVLVCFSLYVCLFVFVCLSLCVFELLVVTDFSC